MTDPRPSIAELQRLCHDDTANHDADLAPAAPVLLEIAAAALALGPELVYLRGPLSERLRGALSKVRP